MRAEPLAAENGRLRPAAVGLASGKFAPNLVGAVIGDAVSGEARAIANDRPFAIA
jgi:hypothetical protein